MSSKGFEPSARGHTSSLGHSRPSCPPSPWSLGRQTIFFPDRSPGTRYTVPVPCYLVAHPRGHVLFDTGVHRQALVDPLGRLGERRARLFRVRSKPHEEVVSQLALIGLSPDEAAYVTNSHFHFDHCGGNEFFPRSTFLVQRKEMEAARDPAVLAQQRYFPSFQDFDHPLGSTG